MKEETKKKILLWSAIVGTTTAITGVIGFFVKKQKQEVMHKGEKKSLYPQDLILEKTVLKLIPYYVLPNHVSVLRILLTPFAAILVAESTSLILVAFVFLFTAATDLIDGAMARTRDQITDIGKILDPVADKLLVFITGYLIMPKFDALPILILMLVVEVISISIATFFFRKGADMSANIFGKIKLNLQVFGITCFIVANTKSLDNFVDYGIILLSLSVVFNVIGIIYFLFKQGWNKG